ncbi:MAG TPA: helix-turn-helix transcriptional regulator [Candidatus Acidoferrales bacterium]|nr:helix-turn-helix transcriptional regulator [Candidatus Acidoferrales bacterium]
MAQSLESVRAVLMSPAGADEAANVSTGLCAPASTQSPPFEMGLEPLSKREIEVLKHVAEGQSTKQAAAIMGITFKTASCHRQHVMAKLGIHDTASLVRYAIRRGIAAA